MTVLNHCLALLMLARIVTGYTMPVTANNEVTGVYYSTPSNAAFQVPLSTMVSSLTTALTDTVPIPNDAQVIGFCGSNSALTSVAALLLDGNGVAQDFVFKCTNIGLDDVVNNEAWLSNTYDDSVWTAPTNEGPATSVFNWPVGVTIPPWYTLGTSKMCCRYVFPFSSGPCDEIPGLCYPGVCSNNDTSDVGYTCDCGTTGYTGVDCEIPGRSSGCESIEVPWCQECAASSEIDCITNGRWRACGNTDPVCQTDITRDQNGVVVSYTRYCTGRLECPEFQLGVDFCDTIGNESFTGSVCKTCTKSACTDYCAPTQPLHCFTCHCYDDVGCWITGSYKECPPNSMCYYTHGFNSSSTSGRMQVWRGCKPRNECTLAAKTLSKGDCTTNADYCTKCGYGSAFPNLPEKKLAICGDPSQGTCSCKGDPHCFTFDEVYIEELPGSCIYTFARDNCKDGLPEGPPTFEVSIDLKYMTNTKVSVHKVFTSYAGEVVKMGQDVHAVRLGDIVTDIWNRTEADPLVTPQSTIITYSSGAARVELSNQVVVEWDFKKQVAVHVPNTFMMNMCGICGNFDMHPAMDFTFGPREAAIEKCPLQTDVLLMLPSGQPALPGQEQEMTLSWISDEDHFDVRCHNECHGDEEE